MEDGVQFMLAPEKGAGRDYSRLGNDWETVAGCGEEGGESDSSAYAFRLRRIQLPDD